jgi:Icc protein
VRLLHLTDPHLLANPEGTLQGVPTRRTLERVLDRVRAEEPDPAAFLLTGDLSQDETKESYRFLSDLFTPFDRPVIALAGNHDDPAAMAAGFAEGGGRVSTARSHGLGTWRVVVADTRVPGEVGGALAPKERAALDVALGEEPDRPTLLALHHHPVPTGCAWLDAIALAHPDALFRLLDRHPQVRCVVWGHVHQEQDRTRNGVRLLSSPATCIQFRPGSAKFALDDRPPGYRWLDLRPDGTLRTGVRRLPAGP